MIDAFTNPMTVKAEAPAEEERVVIDATEDEIKAEAEAEVEAEAEDQLVLGKPGGMEAVDVDAWIDELRVKAQAVADAAAEEAPLSPTQAVEAALGALGMPVRDRADADQEDQRNAGAARSIMLDMAARSIMLDMNTIPALEGEGEKSTESAAESDLDENGGEVAEDVPEALSEDPEPSEGHSDIDQTMAALFESIEKVSVAMRDEEAEPEEGAGDEAGVQDDEMSAADMLHKMIDDAELGFLNGYSGGDKALYAVIEAAINDDVAEISVTARDGLTIGWRRDIDKR